MTRERLTQHALGSGASVVAVATVTGAIYAFKPYVPVLSLGVLYLFAVLPVAVIWGLGLALLVSVASMLTFNFLFLPPLYTFTLADSANWFALSVYFATSVVVSHLAASARRRAAAAEQRERESALLAELAVALLRGRPLEEEVGEVATRTAAVLGVGSAEIELGGVGRDRPGRRAHPLDAAGRHVGTIHTPANADQGADIRRRFLPALAALLAVASEREQLEREALEAEALRRSDLVKTAILRAVSHDLRSPLTGIHTAIGALRSTTLILSDDDRRDLLETIDLESDRLDRLVGDLLDLSRLEAGAAPPQREAWELTDLIREAVGELKAKDRVEIAGDEPVVEVDGAQLQRAFANVLDNALKFSPDGVPVHIEITTTPTQAIARVVDHGPGVQAAELERVFEPFFRRDGDSRSGAGLGLAIARGFVEANGGRVWAESRAGQGTTFAIALPVATMPPELAR